MTLNKDRAKEALKQGRDSYIAKRAKQDALIDRIKKQEIDYEELKKDFLLLQDSVQFLNDLANSRRNNIKEKLELILSEAVQCIYGAGHSVVMEYDTKRNRSHLDFFLYKETEDGLVKRTMEGFGGGIADCISVPLRLLVLIGSKQTDKVCVLDECFKHVSVTKAEKVGQFLKDISEKLNVQIIMASHQEGVKNSSDKLIQLENNGGVVKILE